MCIICAAAKKRYMHREEVLESMRVNSSGFFMAALKPDGSRKTIRTLDDKEAIKFFDDTVEEEDAFVMHARIPSRGAKTLDNVHGWESDGILFMHNMTITDVDDMMKRVKWNNTDSEFFFRKIFIPYYRGLGEEAYKDGKFHPDLDNIVTHFVSYSNKFCFIMPDNVVIRYGQWVSEPDRKLEDGTIAFYASNSGYKVYSKAGRGGTAAGAAGFRNRIGFGSYNDVDDYDDYADYAEYGYYYGSGFNSVADTKHARRKKSKPAAATAAKKTIVPGEMLLKLAGVKGVCQLALAHLVLENTIECRYIYSENKTEEKIQAVLKDFLPGCCKGTYKALKGEFKSLVEPGEAGFTTSAVKGYVEEFAANVAAIYEEKMYKDKTPYAVTPSEWAVKLGLEATIERLNLIMRLNNVFIDFGNPDARDFVKAYVMSSDGTGFDEVFIDDVLSLDIMTVDSAVDAVQMLLGFITDSIDQFYAQDDEPAAEAKGTESAGDTEPESLEDMNEIEGSAAALTDGDNVEIGDEEVDTEDEGLAGVNLPVQDDDSNSPTGAA